MGVDTKDNGKVIRGMGQGNKYGLMEQHFREIINLMKKAVMENFAILMEIHIQENLKRAKEKVRGL